MPKYAARVAAATLFAGAAVFVSPTHAITVIGFRGANLVSKANLTPADAERTALEARPGQVADKELRQEPLGKRLHYEFDIRQGPRMFDVSVDARTGDILQNIDENLEP